MSEKKYLDSNGLIRVVANILDKFAKKTEVDEKISGITSGTVVVKEAEHADSADTATKADTATNANHAATADSATNATNATNAIKATNANHANTADSADHAATADSATNATHADTADSATKATKDGSGNVITETYQTIAAATSQHSALQSSIDAKVPTSRTVNGKALTSNITLSASDVSAYSKSEIDGKVSTINSAIAGKEASGTAASAVSTHNTSTSAHNDIRLLIEDLTTRLNTLANSTDEDLDQMAEIVTYIKSNKSLIDSITTSKVSVSDIINNLTTNVTNKPLSAAQGVAIKTLIDALQAEVDANESSISKLQTKVDGIEEGAQVNVNSDWNQNDPNEDSYIENRPFYTGEPVLTAVVDNVMFTTSDYNGLGAAMNPFSLTLEEGVEYVVTWNGTDYATTCTVMDGLLAIGNGSIFGMADDTGEPFLIGYSGSIMLYATSVGSVTITVKRNDAEVHKIDSKYIDFPEGSSVGLIYDGVGEIFNDYENNVASGSYSHAEGAYTEASGHWSHAEGYHTKAYDRWTHAEGYATKAHGDAQHVQGKYNIEDTAKTYAHIVGNGTSSVPSNAHTLDWDGNAWYQGSVKVGGTSYDDATELLTNTPSSLVNLGMPATAIVGQTAVVKAIDENGMPIEWEAADLGNITIDEDGNAWFGTAEEIYKIPEGLPDYTADDEGKILSVVDGSAAWSENKGGSGSSGGGGIVVSETEPTDESVIFWVKI